MTSFASALITREHITLIDDLLFEKMENITQSFVVRERIAMDNIEITPLLYM